MNFSAGPATLPPTVLEEVQPRPGVDPRRRRLAAGDQPPQPVVRRRDRRGGGQPARRCSRSPPRTAWCSCRAAPSMQFSMVPHEPAARRRPPAAYVVTGSWGAKALAEAAKEGSATASMGRGARRAIVRVPAARRTRARAPGDAYLHITANETIQGVEWPAGAEPDAPDPRLRRLERLPLAAGAVARYGLLYAGAQKNAGPAGVTVAIVREDLLDRHPRRPARDARLPHLRRARVPVQHAARVRDLRPDARHPLAARRGRRPRGAAGAQPREGGAAVRRDRRVAAASTGATRSRAREPDERHVAAARRRSSRRGSWPRPPPRAWSN